MLRRTSVAMALALCLVLLAVRAMGVMGPPAGASFKSPPRIIQHADSPAPLTAEVEVATRELTSVRLEIRSEERVENSFSFPEFRFEHRVPLLGLRPGRIYRIEVIVADEGGTETKWDAPLDVQTPSLPADFPRLQVAVSKPDRMEPGVTVFNLNSAPSGDPSYIVAVNDRGEVIWYYRSEYRVSDVRRIRNGNILFLGASGAIQNLAVEIDMLGNMVRRWNAAGSGQSAPAGSIPVATDSFHHEIFELPSSSFLVLSSALRKFDNYWTSDRDPTAPRVTGFVVDDLVVEFSTDGRIVQQWSMMDLLDPYRIGYGSLGGGWNATYPDAGGPTHDWGHGNAVIWDSRDDSIIVSLYHQDAVVKFNRRTGQLIWILGTHDGWGPKWQPYLLQPRGEMEWQFHQHAPALTPSGTILLFDNGGYRNRPFNPGMPLDVSYSRAVEYAVDAENHTLSQVWKYGGANDEIFFSRPLGDADWMPRTGNILITDGARATDSEGRSSADFSVDNIWARIVEVTHSSPAEKVFELIVHEPIKDRNTGWYIYRAERLPQLYPR